MSSPIQTRSRPTSTHHFHAERKFAHLRFVTTCRSTPPAAHHAPPGANRPAGRDRLRVLLFQQSAIRSRREPSPPGCAFSPPSPTACCSLLDAGRPRHRQPATKPRMVPRPNAWCSPHQFPWPSIFPASATPTCFSIRYPAAPAPSAPTLLAAPSAAHPRWRKYSPAATPAACLGTSQRPQPTTASPCASPTSVTVFCSSSISSRS